MVRNRQIIIIAIYGKTLKLSMVFNLPDKNEIVQMAETSILAGFVQFRLVRSSWATRLTNSIDRALANIEKTNVLHKEKACAVHHYLLLEPASNFSFSDRNSLLKQTQRLMRRLNSSSLFSPKLAERSPFDRGCQSDSAADTDVPNSTKGLENLY